jgi:ribosomal protein L6
MFRPEPVMSSPIRLLLVSACVAALAVSPALAQAPAAAPTDQTQGTRTTVYDAAFFSPYAPRTALDIVQRIPGFTLDLGSTQTANGTVDVRGFAGVAGNVVINGARPSSKSETLQTLLARIPASRVVRVEVGPGDLVQNLVTGVTEGFTKVLEITGVGYRAQAQGKNLRLQLGYSHDVNYKLPEGIDVKTPDQNTVEISGIDKQKVGQVAAEIRRWRKPEPYKGKGIKYRGEYIFRKEGKKK